MTKFRKYGHAALSGFMMIWLSGCAFLFLCNLQMDEPSDSCPLAKYSHCDKAERAKAAEKFSGQTGDHDVDCCAFISGFYDRSRSLEKNQPFAIAKPDLVVLAVSQPPARTGYAPVHLRPAIILPRNDIFLKNRTFRI